MLVSKITNPGSVHLAINLVFKIGPVSIYSKEELTDDHDPKKTCETHLISRTLREIARMSFRLGLCLFWAASIEVK